MNALTNIALRSGPRIATLDPFGVRDREEGEAGEAGEAQCEPEAGYGCVDWYAYGEEPAADPRTQQVLRVPTPRGGRGPASEEAQ